MSERFTRDHIETWRRDGAVVIPGFFTPGETAAVQADFASVFGRSAGADDALVLRKEGEPGKFNPAQFASIQSIPFDCSPALNLAGVHPALIDFARRALGHPDLRLYQCQAWAKFTGDADYDQPFHCDYANHTLTAPSEDTLQNTMTFICLFSDVTDAHGPTHYVTRPDAEKIAGPEASLSPDPEVQARLQRELPKYARTNAAPAGSLFAYGIDIYHRGSNLTAPGGHRFVLTSCFKRAGDDAIAFTAWAYHHTKPWRRIFEHASPEQLTCFGVQPPGHPFWTEETLRRAQARYPGWDMSAYRQAARSSARAKLEVQR